MVQENSKMALRQNLKNQIQDTMNQLESRIRKEFVPSEILDKLLTRFIIGVPKNVKQNLIRICFQIELAYWNYLDFHVANDLNLKKCKFFEFAAHVFLHTPFLRKECRRFGDILTAWKQYKQTLPTYGAAIISENTSHVLLVQSFGRNSWGCPKGKIDEGEDPAHCAIREVMEETGFDITNLLSPDEWMESTINGQLLRLYIIKNVPFNTTFQPQTRGEIKTCKWFAVADLPTSRKDDIFRTKMRMSPNAFFMVLPFVKRLKMICNASKIARRKLASVSVVENSISRPTVHSATNVTQSEKKIEKKDCLKRQLFVDDSKADVCAPSRLNFKFEQTAFMEYSACFKHYMQLAISFVTNYCFRRT